MNALSPPVTLREINAETVRAICNLQVAESQKSFVADNAVSLAQALFSPEAWFRAIYLGDEPVGFVMLYDEALRPAPPERPEVGVWRFMVDKRYQGKGIGKNALLQVIEHVKGKRLYSKLELSYVPGPGCAEEFYRSLGFLPNGKLEGNEVVLELLLPAANEA
jgi:diamine N-acetyltransferase